MKVFEIDQAWPKWVYEKFTVSYFFANPKSDVDLSKINHVSHTLFADRPKALTFQRSDKRSVVIISDGKKTIGEAWLRLNLSIPLKSPLLRQNCEMYSYNRGFRDELTAQMDGAASGIFVVPRRESDLICAIDNRKKTIRWIWGAFGVRLSMHHSKILD
jgi:hypothetical protein